MSENDSQSILNTYKAMTSECQTIANKITELTSEKDEHKLVVDTLTKLESGRKAFRLVGGVLVERTVEEVLPAVSQNFEGVSVDRFLQRPTLYRSPFDFLALTSQLNQIKDMLQKLDETLKSKDKDRKAFKEKHGIMTQDERNAMMKRRSAN